MQGRRDSVPCVRQQTSYIRCRIAWHRVVLYGSRTADNGVNEYDRTRNGTYECHDAKNTVLEQCEIGEARRDIGRSHREGARNN